MPSTSDKSQLRHLARATRKALRDDAYAGRLASHASLLNVRPGMIVAAYHGHQDEADPVLLVQALARMGAHVAFPRVTARDRALEFHLVPDGEILRPGTYNIHEPLEHWPRQVPDLLLVPLLAFDDQGYRLGYGGGYYDRTLASLSKVRAIGIAYAGQRMDFLPHDAHDYPLNAILTENGLTEFPR